jgi:hypothetical protein
MEIYRVAHLMETCSKIATESMVGLTVMATANTPSL